MPRNTFISVCANTKERFAQMKQDYSENPEARDDIFVNELLDFAEENFEDEEEDIYD